MENEPEVLPLPDGTDDIEEFVEQEPWTRGDEEQMLAIAAYWEGVTNGD